MNNSILEPNKDILDRLSFYVMTDIGRKRENNQDNFVVVSGENFKLFVVCDGMGGTDGGEIASQMTISYLEVELSGKKINDIEDIKKVVYEANKLVFEYGMNNKEVQGLGTTITSLLVMQKGSWILNVGDSRIYKILGNSLTQITEDDTVLHELIKSGVVTEDKAKSHPIANMLTKTIGQGESLEIETTRIGFLNNEECYLLCSDGLYNMVSDDEILEILHHHSPKESVKTLINKANENGGADNITVMLVGTFRKDTSSNDNTVITQKSKFTVSKEISNKISYSGLAQKVKDSHYSEEYNEYKGNVKHNNYKTNQKAEALEKAQVDHKKFVYFLAIFIVLILFVLFIPTSSVKNIIHKKKIFVDKVGKINIVEENYILKIKDMNNKMYSVTNLDFSEKEDAEYNEILNIIESKATLDKKLLVNKKNDLVKFNKELEEKLEKLDKAIIVLKGYNNQNILTVARDIELYDENVKRLLDDYFNFSYNIKDENLTQEEYDRLKSKKLNDLDAQIKLYIDNKFKELFHDSKNGYEKFMKNQFDISMIDLKLEYITALESGSEETLNDFKIKIMSLKERINNNK